MSASNEELEQAVHVALETLHDCDRRNNGFAALTELCARLRRAEEALKPFARFAEQFDRMPMNGIADAFYGIHFGTEYEAELKLSDCRRARAALQNKEG